MNRIIKIFVNFEKKSSERYIFKQLDSTELHCYFNGNINLNNRVSCVFTKPDKTINRINATDIDSKNKVAKFVLPMDCVRDFGKVEIEIELIKDEEVISTFITSGFVEKTNKENIQSDNTPNYLEEIEKKITEAHVILENATNDLNNANKILKELDGKLDEISDVKKRTETLEEVVKTIPTKTSELLNDSDFAVDSNYVHTDNNYTNEEKIKLEELENYDDSSIKSRLEIGESKINTNTTDISGLKKNVESIEDKIPTQATKENQLADKDFVNSSIATSTATFRGNYNSLEELQQVEADINDYANIEETDDLGNVYYNRYTYDGNTWIFNFKINTTTFTIAQWKAINSNATPELIEKLTNIDLTDYVKNTDTVITNKELLANKTTLINSNSTDTQYPSAKATYNYIASVVGDINTLLDDLNGEVI